MYLDFLIVKKYILKMAILGMALSVSGCHHVSVLWQQAPHVSSVRKVANQSVYVAQKYRKPVVNHYVVYDRPDYVSQHIINHHVIYDRPYYVGPSYVVPSYVRPSYFHHQRSFYRGSLMSEFMDIDD